MLPLPEGEYRLVLSICINTYTRHALDMVHPVNCCLSYIQDAAVETLRYVYRTVLDRSSC